MRECARRRVPSELLAPPLVCFICARTQVSEKKQLYNFSVESTGALAPELIVQRGVEVLQRKLKDIRANLKSADQMMEQ